MKNRQYLLSVLLLALLAGFGWWLSSARDAPAASRSKPHTPEYMATGLAILTTGEDGKPKYRLKAERMRHYDDDGSTELEAPRLSVYHPTTPPWEIESERGWVSEDGELVRLQGQVIITRAESPEARPVRIVTSELQVEPEREYAETDQHVEVYSNDDWVVSDGAQVWFSQAMRVKFLSNVRGRYEIN